MTEMEAGYIAHKVVSREDIHRDCAVRITLEVLAKFLNLPKHCRIVSVFQDSQDLASFGVSIVIAGQGVKRGEGGHVRYVNLSDITGVLE